MTSVGIIKVLPDLTTSNHTAHFRYYITTAILPMFFITIVGMSSFAVPIRYNDEGDFTVADKLAVSVTAMLGGVVFRLASVSDLPRLGYLTYLDWYLLSCEITQ